MCHYRVDLVACGLIGRLPMCHSLADVPDPSISRQYFSCGAVATGLAHHGTRLGQYSPEELTLRVAVELLNDPHVVQKSERFDHSRPIWNIGVCIDPLLGNMGCRRVHSFVTREYASGHTDGLNLVKLQLQCLNSLSTIGHDGYNRHPKSVR